MPEDTNDDTGYYLDLAKYGVGAAGAAAATAEQQAAYQAILQNLRDRFEDYKNLTPAQYQALTAQTLGPSALSNIAPDAQARVDEQDQISQLDEIAKEGGLTLADREALNKLESKLSRSAAARNA